MHFTFEPINEELADIVVKHQADAAVRIAGNIGK